MLQELYLQQRQEKLSPNSFTIIFNIWRICVKNSKGVVKAGC